MKRVESLRNMCAFKSLSHTKRNLPEVTLRLILTLDRVYMLYFTHVSVVVILHESIAVTISVSFELSLLYRLAAMPAQEDVPWSSPNALLQTGHFVQVVIWVVSNKHT